jgi:DNA-binding HxlR family transcriptional regulator
VSDNHPDRTNKGENEGDAGSKAPAPIFIGRWTPKILFSLKERPHRHGELRRHIGNVSQRMLTRTLRNLESTGLVARRVTRSKPIAVEYSLSKLGRTIIVPLKGMCRWAKRHGKHVSADMYVLEAAQSLRNQ